MKNRILLLLLVLSMGCFCNAANYSGDFFRLKQPDGSLVAVRVYGDEFYHEVESIDGYILIRDEKTKEICYALLSSDGNEYKSSGVKYEGGKVPLTISLRTKPHTRIAADAINKRIREKKLRLGFNPDGSSSSGLRSVTVLPDTVYGITVLVNFKDVKSNFTKKQIEEFLNGDNYNEFGNSCSVKEYFQRISGGKLTYLNLVTDFITLPLEKLHYEQNRDALLEAVSDIILSDKYVKRSDLSRVSTPSRGDNYVPINIMYAGCPDFGWLEGLWPHASYAGITIDKSAPKLNPYQITNIGEDDLTVGCFIHETAHLLCGWPDFYSYTHSNTNNNTYGFGTQFISDGVKSPLDPSPLCLDWMGWLKKTDITNLKNGEVVTLRNRVGEAAVYYKSSSRKDNDERYYLEVRREPYDGIFVWHVNPKGDNVNASLCSDLQLEDCRPANFFDPCFKKGLKQVFNDNNEPSARWDDGTFSGIDIWDISEAGDVMTFRCGYNIDSLKIDVKDTCVGFVGQHFETKIYSMLYKEEGLKFRLARGYLPEGIVMDSCGVVSGVPTKEGLSKIVVEACFPSGIIVVDTIMFEIRAVEKLIRDNIAHKIPGVIRFEDFMIGGENVAFHDYTDNDVDTIKNIWRESSVFMEQGEWIRYYVEVEEYGEYEIEIRHGDFYDKTMDYRIYMNDSLLIDYKYEFDIADRCANIEEEKSIYERGSVYYSVKLPKGKHVLKVVADKNISFDEMIVKKQDEDSVVNTIPGGVFGLYYADVIKDMNGNLTEHLKTCPQRFYRPDEICKHMFDFYSYEEYGFDFLIEHFVDVEKNGWYILSEAFDGFNVMLDGVQLEVKTVSRNSYDEYMVYLPEGKHKLTFNYAQISFMASSGYFSSDGYICFLPTYIEPVVFHDTIVSRIGECRETVEYGIPIIEGVTSYIPYTVETRGLGRDSVNSGLPMGAVIKNTVEFNETGDSIDLIFLSWSNQRAGSYDFEIILTDTTKNTFRDTVHLEVLDWKNSFPKERLVVGELYSERLPICGLEIETRGIGEDSLSSGLPEGITLTSTSFSGTPEKTGEYKFELIARYVEKVAHGGVASQDDSLIIIRDTIALKVHEKTKPYKEAYILPCVVEAEDFDLGGEGAAYYLEEKFTGVLSDYRSDSVEIQKNIDKYSLVLNEGDWFIYSIVVENDGLYSVKDYDLNSAGVEFLDEKGERVEGVFFNSLILQQYQNNTFFLSRGRYYLKVYNYVSEKIVIDNIKIDDVIRIGEPYGSIHKIPGKIDLLEFDKGLECYDNDCENKGGAVRPDESVDIYDKGDGEYAILFEMFDKMNYTVQLAPSSSRKYTVTIPYECYETSACDALISLHIYDRDYGFISLNSYTLNEKDTVCSFVISIPEKVGDNSSGYPVLILEHSWGDKVFIKELIVEETNNSVADIKVCDFDIYPNPTTDEFVVNIAKDNVVLTVLNVQGVVVNEYKNLLKGKIRFGKELPCGVYVVNIVNGNNIVSKKIVKL